VTGDSIVERLAQLEEAVRRAADALTRLREENVQLRREVRRLADERKQVVAQVDAILKDIARLELEKPE
jgi:cell division protein FtsB